MWRTTHTGKQGDVSQFLIENISAIIEKPFEKTLMSDHQTQTDPEESISRLHLKYLEASFEGFRRSGFYLILINAGATLALIGLFPVFVSAGANLQTIAPLMKCPLLFFLFGLIASIISLSIFSLSAHKAAWGNTQGEKKYRNKGILFILAAIILFAIGAFSAICIISNPASFRPLNKQNFTPVENILELETEYEHTHQTR